MYHSTRADRGGTIAKVALDDQHLGYAVFEASVSPGGPALILGVSARTMFYCASGRGWISFLNHHVRHTFEPGVVFVAEAPGEITVEAIERMTLLRVEPHDLP